MASEWSFSGRAECPSSPPQRHQFCRNLFVALKTKRTADFVTA
jgi:hypothetical protein